MTADVSRTSAALAASLAIHAAVLALLLAHRPVELSLHPARVLLVLAAADHTAGPGRRDDALRSAAPSPAAAPAATESRPAPVMVPAKPVPEPLAAERVVTRKPPPKPAERKDLASNDHGAAPPAANPLHTADTGTDASSIASAGAGADKESSAPAWAPAARVRYEELLFAWIDRHKQYPLLAQRRGLEGAGSVRIRIDRDGRLLDRALVRSTGQAMLDDATLDMVRRASPFPPVPREYAGASFEFVAPVEYRLR